MSARSSGGSRKVDLALLVVLLGVAALCLWGAGTFDSKINAELRVSNLYAADGVDIDEAEAERDIGNRQLVVAMLDSPLDEQGGDICDDAKSVADGAVVVIIGSDMSTYGCALIAGYDDEELGKAFVIESRIGLGLDGLADSPQDAVKAVVVNFDQLVDAGLAPQDARSIDPPFARYILATIALSVILLGATVIFWRGRLLAKWQADAIERRARARGKLAERDSALAAAGVQILALDERYQRVVATAENKRSAADRTFMRRYADQLRTYTRLNAEATDHEPDPEELPDQIAAAEALTQKLARL
ncbi:MAG: hypothetical protein ACK5MR_09610 [Cumulibacter sp.]